MMLLLVVLMVMIVRDLTEWIFSVSNDMQMSFASRCCCFCRRRRLRFVLLRSLLGLSLGLLGDVPGHMRGVIDRGRGARERVGTIV
jgi:hypothetical protein